MNEEFNSVRLKLGLTTVVLVYINTLKTTYNFNFNFYQVFKQQKHLNNDKLTAYLCLLENLYFKDTC